MTKAMMMAEQGIAGDTPTTGTIWMDTTEVPIAVDKTIFQSRRTDKILRLTSNYYGKINFFSDSYVLVV